MITKSVISVKEALLLFTKLPSYGYRIPQENFLEKVEQFPTSHKKVEASDLGTKSIQIQQHFPSISYLASKQ